MGWCQKLSFYLTDALINNILMCLNFLKVDYVIILIYIITAWNNSIIYLMMTMHRLAIIGCIFLVICGTLIGKLICYKKNKHLRIVGAGNNNNNNNYFFKKTKWFLKNSSLSFIYKTCNAYENILKRLFRFLVLISENFGFYFSNILRF